MCCQKIIILFNWVGGINNLCPTCWGRQSAKERIIHCIKDALVHIRNLACTQKLQHDWHNSCWIDFSTVATTMIWKTSRTFHGKKHNDVRDNESPHVFWMHSETSIEWSGASNSIPQFRRDRNGDRDIDDLDKHNSLPCVGHVGSMHNTFSAIFISAHATCRAIQQTIHLPKLPKYNTGMTQTIVFLWCVSAEQWLVIVCGFCFCMWRCFCDHHLGSCNKILR